MALAITTGMPPTFSFDSLSNVNGAYSLSRKLISAYGGSFYQMHGGQPTKILWVFSQLGAGTGAAGDFTFETAVGNSPTVTTAGSGLRTALDFTGAVWLTAFSATLDTFINAASGYFVVSLIIDSFDTNNTTNTFSNQAVWGDQGVFAGLFLKSAGPRFMAYNFDVNDDHADVTTGVATATVMVIEWIHTGGNLTCCVNGGTDVTVASAGTSDLTRIVYLGSGGAGSTILDGKVFEWIFAHAVPTAQQRASLVTNMLGHVNGF